jgi:hypothetical protein
MNLFDARSEQRAVLAVLLDEVGACARGELPLPAHDQLVDWLGMFNTVAGSAGVND